LQIYLQLKHNINIIGKINVSKLLNILYDICIIIFLFFIEISHLNVNNRYNKTIYNENKEEYVEIRRNLHLLI